LGLNGKPGTIVSQLKLFWTKITKHTMFLVSKRRSWYENSRKIFVALDKGSNA